MIRPKSHKTTDIATGKALPLRSEAALAVMQMGITDYGLIATAVGIPEEEVARIDHSEDERIRRLAVHGVDPAKRYHLVRPLRCPKCRARISVAPCLICYEM